MADGDQTPLDPEPDPTEGDEEPEAEDTAEDDDQPGSDQATQLADAQRLIAQQNQELNLLRGKAADEGDEPDEPASSDDFLARATQDSWALAETIHGAEAMDAYRVAYRLYERAQTPADFVTAFEAYHLVRNGKLPAPDKGGQGAVGKTRADATKPRVDANRSDPGSDLANAEAQIAEAKKSGSLDRFASAAAAAMGFGPAKR